MSYELRAKPLENPTGFCSQLAAQASESLLQSDFLPLQCVSVSRLFFYKLFVVGGRKEAVEFGRILE